jgi:hypothetical protein
MSLTDQDINDIIGDMTAATQVKWAPSESQVVQNAVMKLLMDTLERMGEPQRIAFVQEKLRHMFPAYDPITFNGPDWLREALKD